MPRIIKEEKSLWKADVTLKVKRLAFACQDQRIRKRYPQKKRHIIATDWLDTDKKSIIWDVGKRLQGG